jgi:O-antigen ligase
MKAAHNTTTDQRARPRQLESILLYGTFGLLMFGPIAFGGVEPWSVFVLEAGTAILFLFWIVKQVSEGEIRVRNNPLFLPMGVFGLLILSQLAFRLSAYPHATLSGAILYCAYAVLCFLTGQTFLRTAQARKLAVIFSVYGAAMGSFALLQSLSPNGKLYWIRQPSMGGWIYGSYVNHNHYAGLMEMLIPIPLVLSLSRLTDSKQRMAAAAAAAVMVGTVFLSGSRGGMLALVMEFGILAVVMIRQKHSLRAALTMGVFLAIVVGLLVWVGGNELGQRVATLGAGAHSDLSEAMRLKVNVDGFHMFLKKPILGWGLGTFPVVYPQFRSFYTNFFVNQAHDDYLQLLVETGLVGFCAMVWFLVVLFRNALKKIGNWTAEISGAVTLACLMGVSGILVHSAVDFNLQIPANAALFYAFCTIAAADPLLQPARKKRPIRPPARETLATSEVV